MISFRADRTSVPPVSEIYLPVLSEFSLFVCLSLAGVGVGPAPGPWGWRSASGGMSRRTRSPAAPVSCCGAWPRRRLAGRATPGDPAGMSGGWSGVFGRDRPPTGPDDRGPKTIAYKCCLQFNYNLIIEFIIPLYYHYKRKLFGNLPNRQHKR